MSTDLADQAGSPTGMHSARDTVQALRNAGLTEMSRKLTKRGLIRSSTG